MNFKEIFEKADFEVKVRYNHLDQKLEDIDDELMELYVDQICTLLDIEIAETLEEKTTILRAELDEIEKNIDYFENKYDVVSDYFDRELLEIFTIAEKIEFN